MNKAWFFQLDMAFKIDPGSIEVLRDLGVLALEAKPDQLRVAEPRGVEKLEKGPIPEAERAFPALRLDDGRGLAHGQRPRQRLEAGSIRHGPREHRLPTTAPPAPHAADSSRCRETPARACGR